MTARTNNKRYQESNRLMLFTENSYLERTARPIYAITFLVPFIILYEIGTIAFNTGLDHSQIRVVSFVWIQQLLSFIGFTPRIAWIGAPLAVLIILLAMQITSKAKWKIHVPDLFVMVAECIALAVPLIVLSLLMNRPSMDNPIYLNQNISPAQTEQVDVFSDPQPQFRSETNKNLMGIIVTGIGAGIYEELVFRLIMIGIFIIIFQDILGLKPSHAIIISVIASSLFFSLHHHFIFLDGEFSVPEKFSTVSFLFRTLAGIYFAVLYAIRGYGITAGTHAFYDIIIAILNSIIFN